MTDNGALEWVSCPAFLGPHTCRGIGADPLDCAADHARCWGISATAHQLAALRTRSDWSNLKPVLKDVVDAYENRLAEEDGRLF